MSMKVIMAFVAFVAFVSTSSAAYIQVSASNNDQTFSAGMGGNFNTEAAAMQRTTFDMTGTMPETTNFHSAFGMKDIITGETYDYTYQNHFVGHHVTGTYSIHHPTIGNYETSFEIDI